MIRFITLAILLFQGNAKTISDYFNEFPGKGEFSLKASDANEVTIDNRNAFIKIVKHGDEDYPFDSEIQFTYFSTATKTKIFGVSEVERGPNTDAYNYNFYKIENNRWVEVTNKVLPEIRFDLFSGEIDGLEQIGSNFELEFVLPQQGTTITVIPHPVSETDNPFSDDEDGYRKYLDVFHNLLHDQIQLKWNREKSAFEVLK